MNDVSSLNHSQWECKYHVVWIPKYRKKALYGQLRKYLGQVFKDLARNRECEVLEGHMMADHVHMLISIPPKYDEGVIRRYIAEQERGTSTLTSCCLRNRRSHLGWLLKRIRFERFTNHKPPALPEVADCGDTP